MTRARKNKIMGPAQHNPGRLSLTPLYKTRLCNFYPSGKCRDGQLCSYAHGEEELRLSPDFERTSVCPILIKEGSCTRHDCRYAHNSGDLRTSPVLLKTKMCRFFLNGNCVVGEACRFAHSVDELTESVHVQQERLPAWAERRRRFCETAVPRQVVQRSEAPTLLSQAEPMFVQPSFWKSDRLPGASENGRPLVDMLPGEARVLSVQPPAVLPVPLVPPPGLVRMGDQTSVMYDLDATKEACETTNDEQVAETALDTNALLTTFVGEAGKIVIEPSSLDADAQPDADIVAEDVALRRAHATWVFAGIGAVGVLWSYCNAGRLQQLMQSQWLLTLRISRNWARCVRLVTCVVKPGQPHV